MRSVTKGPCLGTAGDGGSLLGNSGRSGVEFRSLDPNYQKSRQTMAYSGSFGHLAAAQPAAFKDRNRYLETCPPPDFLLRRSSAEEEELFCFAIFELNSCSRKEGHL